MADFFSSSVRDMTLDEVQPLFKERVQENIRLEYKRELAGDAGEFKKVLAKELSSLANTYGGYVVIGIATDPQGNPTAMDGIPRIDNFAQRVASIGYEQVYPPMVPTVSNPIVLENGNVVYVIHQDLSLEAPHFLTRRRGAYVRTSEFSQTFEAQLASWEELQFLANRRSQAIGRRSDLYQRARTRCNRMLPWAEMKNRAVLCVWTSPSFPGRRLIELSRLQDTMEKTVGVLATAAISLQDSLAYADAESGYRNHYIEATAYGTYFSCRNLLPDDATKVHLGSLFGSLLSSIRAGCKFLVACGFDGTIHVRAMLLEMDGNSFFWTLGFDTLCRQHEEVEVEDETPLETIRGNIGPFCVQLFKAMTFAVGHREAFKGNDNAIIKSGLSSLGRDETFLSI
jgi:hypothetical protein